MYFPFERMMLSKFGTNLVKGGSHVGYAQVAAVRNGCIMYSARTGRK